MVRGADGQPSETWEVPLARFRFGALLVMLVVFLVASPLVGPSGGWLTGALATWAISGLFVMMLLSAVVAVSRSRATTSVAAALAVPIVLLELKNAVAESHGAIVLAYLLAVVFLAFVIAVLIRHLFATAEVTQDTICAAVSAYLLLGILWAMLYSVVGTLDHQAFLTNGNAGDIGFRFDGQGNTAVLYFSFVTLTTLGFGDIVPQNPMAQMLVTSEAVTGQMFLAILVARLVGLHITSEKKA